MSRNSTQNELNAKIDNNVNTINGNIGNINSALASTLKNNLGGQYISGSMVFNNCPALGKDTWGTVPLRLEAPSYSAVVNGGCRGGICFHNPGVNAAVLFLNTNGKMTVMFNDGSFRDLAYG